MYKFKKKIKNELYDTGFYSGGVFVVMCAVSYLSVEVFSNGVIPDLPVLSFWT